MVNDPIADMITQIKNGGNAGRASIAVPHSKLKEAIASVLVREGFVKSANTKGKTVAKSLEIELAYDSAKKPRIEGVERVSHLSKRIYRGSKDIHPVRNGIGIQVISTPKGIVTDKQARKEKVGGEILFKIW